MDNLFEGLKGFVVGDISKDIDIFGDDEKEKSNARLNKNDAEVKTQSEETFIFDKTFNCPVCDNKFTSKIVKTGKARFIGSDSDLRPLYDGIDVVKYETVVCPKCGYAANERTFNEVTSFQIKAIKENISANFKGMVNEQGIYSYEYAISRMEMDLLNKVVKRAKISERSYSCLKIAWLYRGMAENCDKSDPDYMEKFEKYKAEEEKFTYKSYEGFTQAIQKELPPICNMDDMTINYLLAELGRKCKDYDGAIRFTNYILESRSASNKIREKARELRQLIKEEKEKNT